MNEERIKKKPKRITARDIADARRAIEIAKSEPVEYETDANGEYIYEFGRKKALPARRPIIIKERMVKALRFPPDDITALRHRMGNTQAHQARILGVCTRTYQAWERGDVVPSHAKLKDLSSLDETAEAIPPIPPERICEIRQACEFSRAEFARSLGVSPVTLARWESGSTAPKGEQLRKLHGYLDTVVLLGRLEPEEK